MKIKLPSNMRVAPSAGSGAPDPAEPATMPLPGPAAPSESVVPPPVAAPGVGPQAGSAPGSGPALWAGEQAPAGSVIGQVLPM